MGAAVAKARLSATRAAITSCVIGCLLSASCSDDTHGSGAAGAAPENGGGSAGAAQGNAGPDIVSSGGAAGTSGGAGASVVAPDAGGAGFASLDGSAREAGTDGAPDYSTIAVLVGTDAQRCVALSTVTPTDTKIVSTMWQGSYCQVRATQKPSPDSIINIEVHLPARGQYGGKFEGTGNGGFAGQVNVGALDGPVSHGYAAANSDLGTGNTGSDVIGHPQRIEDWGNRATHWMTVASKQMIYAYYGRPPDRSYFVGCSTGGQQALVEAQRYPDDYDGVIAGAPVTNRTRLHENFVWSYSAFNSSPAVKMTAAKLGMLNAAVVTQCDARDGVEDGLIRDARSCTFDPATLLCPGADGPSCLTVAQLDAVKKTYGGMVNPRTTEVLSPGWPRGSELGWGAYTSGGEPPYAAINRWVFGANWDWRTYNFDTDVATLDATLGAAVNAVNPDLGGFLAHGAKLIIWHGWTDAVVNPFDTVSYFEKVAAKMGGATSGFVRLFMAPGVDHCGGGSGPGGFDIESALVKWVETNVAPDQIIASKSGMSRPLCPHPQMAKYKGTGSSNDAANFTCE